MMALLDRGLGPALRRGDERAWLEAAQRLERDWFEDLGAALARFGAIRVVLPGERRTHVATIDAGARWRWFRARRPVASLG